VKRRLLGKQLKAIVRGHMRVIKGKEVWVQATHKVLR